MAYKELMKDVPGRADSYLYDQTDSFICDLIDNYIPNLHSKYQFEARRLDYDFNVPKIGILLKVMNFTKEYLDNVKTYERDEIIKQWKSKIAECLDKFFTSNNNIIISYLGDGDFYILKDITSKEHEEKVVKCLVDSFESIFMTLGKNELKKVRAGISTSSRSIDGIAKSYNEAKTALRLGLKLEPSIQSHHIDSFGILAAVTDGDFERKLYLSRKILDQLDEDTINTLNKYFNNDLSIKKTAKEMGVHRNTINYRLSQIGYKTGFHPKEFNSAVIIKLALFINKLA